MAPVPVRALAHPFPTEPPQRCRRVRLAPSLPIALFLAGLLPGIVLGMVIGPPVSERCGSAPDPIACLILTID